MKSERSFHRYKNLIILQPGMKNTIEKLKKNKISSDQNHNISACPHSTITNSICGSSSYSIIWTISWLTPTKEEREHLSQGKNHGGTASKNNAWLLHIWTFKKLKNVHYWQFLKNNTSHTHTKTQLLPHSALKITK